MSTAGPYSNSRLNYNAYAGKKSLAAKVKAGSSTKIIPNSNATIASNITTPLKIREPFTIEVLHQKLTQYTRGSDRRQMLRLLRNPKECPSSHVMKSVFVEDIAMAEREAAYERGILNGVKFLKVKEAGE